jgi:Zn-dependent peptidase ImmA (M78 family)
MNINKDDLIFKAIDTRKKLKEDENTPINIFGIVEQMPELTIVFAPFPENISGMCIKTDNGKYAVIAISTNMTYGRKRFTLAHELYHYNYGQELKTICESNLQTTSEDEAKANIYASYLLMPDYSLRTFIRDECNDKIDIDSILKIENYYGVSRAALLVRLSRDGFISEGNLEKYKTNVLATAKSKGYSLDIYDKSIKSENTTTGKYVVLANELFGSGSISEGKYRKILLDAFRDDLVYPDNEVIGDNDVFD